MVCLVELLVVVVLLALLCYCVLLVLDVFCSGCLILFVGDMCYFIRLLFVCVNVLFNACLVWLFVFCVCCLSCVWLILCVV